jgi:hypothetical protein
MAALGGKQTLHVRRPATAMQSFVLLLGSVIPIVLVGGGALAFRGARTPQKLVLLLIILLASVPLGALIIEVAFPTHGTNPGQAVKYMFLIEAWILTFVCWLVWVAISVILGLKRPRRRG